MGFLRRRIGMIFQNLFAFAVGAVVVALAQGMSFAEIAEFAASNAHKLPEMIKGMVAQTFAVAGL